MEVQLIYSLNGTTIPFMNRSILEIKNIKSLKAKFRNAINRDYSSLQRIYGRKTQLTAEIILNENIVAKTIVNT